MTAPDYGFQDQLHWSEGVAAEGNIADILLANIPGAIHVIKCEPSDDRNGNDYHVHRVSARPLSIDLKARKPDPVADWQELRLAGPKDDLALETLSVVEKQKIGWTLDESKQTDYVLWLFKSTGRWVIVPFPMLCIVFQNLQYQWVERYGTHTQSSEGGRWHSECVFVPRKVVWRAIYDRFGGEP